MSTLDFLVIGAQKAGTTTLWRLLRDHPQLAFPADKEAGFFTDDRIYPRGLDWFMSAYFGDADPAALRGTVTPPYMTGVTGPDNRGIPVEQVARRIAEALPEVKLIALLRDPVQRAISHYRMSARRGLERRSLTAAVRQQLAPAALRSARAHPSEINGYIAAGEYGRVLQAYRAHVPAERIMVALTDDLDRDPGELVGRVLRFLGADDEWRPRRLEQRHRVGGDSSRVDERDLRALKQSLIADLPEAARGVIDQVLDAWNTIAAPPSQAFPEPLERALREHFAADAAVLEQACGARVPWAVPPPPPRSERGPVAQAPAVSIVILAHDTPDEVEALLASIVAHTDDPYEVVLVDNGSSPTGRDRHAALAQRYGARLVALEQNLSFSIANNIGIASSSGSEVALLNSDVLVTPRWLETLRAALHAGTDIGAVGPRSNFAPRQQGGVWLDDSSPQGVEEFGRGFNHSDPARWFDVDWLGGFALLARRDALDAIGGFDEAIEWFAGEDIALSRTLQAHGWRTVCAGDTFVYHAGHHTFVTTGTNRSATRFARPAAKSPGAGARGGRLVVDASDQVFEVGDGVAAHFETWWAALMVRAGRPLEAAAPGELESLPLAPPISLCRTSGTDQVFVLYDNQRLRVGGNRERIRRLGSVAMIASAELRPHPGGPRCRRRGCASGRPRDQGLAALQPRGDRRRPARPLDPVVEQIGAALSGARLRAHPPRGRRDAGAQPRDVAHGSRRPGTRRRPRWSVAGRAAAAPRDSHRRRGGRARGSWGAEPGAAARTGPVPLRPLPEAPLLERIGFELRGIDPTTGARSDPPLRRLLAGKRVALVCPTAAADWHSASQDSYRRRNGIEVALTVSLDDVRDLESVFDTLAANRGAYDVVLSAATVASKILCARLARELNVVALDLGLGALDDIVHPRLEAGRNPLVALRADVEAYLRQGDEADGAGEHEFEGRLLYVEEGGPRFYIERGMAREVTHGALLALFDQEPVRVPRGVLLGTPTGAALSPSTNRSPNPTCC